MKKGKEECNNCNRHNCNRKESKKRTLTKKGHNLSCNLHIPFPAMKRPIVEMAMYGELTKFGEIRYVSKLRYIGR